MRKSIFALLFVCGSIAQAQRLHPILFVTQTPIPSDFTAIGSVFGNHRADMDEHRPRRRSLDPLSERHAEEPHPARRLRAWRAAFRARPAIAVREPAVHWNGTKALFCMVVGAPTEQYNWGTYYWQLYEVTGLGAADPVTITMVPNQPANANNVSPIYAPDGRILFTSDRPRDGARPSLSAARRIRGGAGRDRDSGASIRRPATWSSSITRRRATSSRRSTASAGSSSPAGTTCSATSRPTATTTMSSREIRRPTAPSTGRASAPTRSRSPPGPSSFRSRAPAATTCCCRTKRGHSFNHFFPWMMNQDGTGLETLNHIGRHELHSYFNRSFNNDPNLDEFICGDNACNRFNDREILNMLEIRESAMVPGLYYRDRRAGVLHPRRRHAVLPQRRADRSRRARWA